MSFLKSLFGTGAVESSANANIKYVQGQDVLSQIDLVLGVGIAVKEHDSELLGMLNSKKVRCAFCDGVVPCASRNQPEAVEFYCSSCGKVWGTVKVEPERPSAGVLQPRQGLSVDLGNGTNLTLEWVPPTPSTGFIMGSPASEKGRAKDETQHTVVLTKGFWLGKTEVTQAQWQSLMGNNPSHFKGDSFPVEKVSWNDAMEYCGKLTERERAAGRLPEGYEYTLPTEAQWEYACRAGTIGAYAGDLDSMAWYFENSRSTAHSVGTKQPNAWGFYDMHGNVWEWCRDWYGNYPSGNVTDPTGPSSGTNRVYRGGSGYFFAGDCRSANRHRVTPRYCNRNIGFRLALGSVR